MMTDEETYDLNDDSSLVRKRGTQGIGTTSGNRNIHSSLSNYSPDSITSSLDSLHGVDF
jgi:hypothetical protein